MPASNWVALRLTADAEFAIKCVELLCCRPGNAGVLPTVIAEFRSPNTMALRELLNVDELARLVISCDVITRFTDGTVIPSSRWDTATQQYCIQGWIRGGSLSIPSISKMLAKLRSSEWQLGNAADWFRQWWNDCQEIDVFWQNYRT